MQYKNNKFLIKIQIVKNQINGKIIVHPKTDKLKLVKR
jgi:hypothetical protein